MWTLVQSWPEIAIFVKNWGIEKNMEIFEEIEKKSILTCFYHFNEDCGQVSWGETDFCQN